VGDTRGGSRGADFLQRAMLEGSQGAFCDSGGESAIAASQFRPATSGYPDRRIRVLVVIHSLDIGGAEMDLLRNLPRLDRSRFVPVVCLLRGLGALAIPLREAGVDVVLANLDAPVGERVLDHFLHRVEVISRWLVDYFPASRFMRLTKAMCEYSRLSRFVARYIETTNTDIVHAILPSAYLTAGLANVLTERRTLLMSRVSLNWYQRDHRVLGLIERWFLHRRVDLAIGNSAAVLEELRAEGILNRKLVLVHNGIDSASFVEAMVDTQDARGKLGIPRHALVFSSVGNLFPHKGHADLLHALSMAGDRLPSDWLLLVAGRDVDGSLSKLRHLAGELGLSQHVRLLGERRDVPVILSAADIHVSASHCEGFPNNILEAMCGRLPVVATAVGGVPEQLIHGETGLLVPAQNSRALSEALLALVRDPDRRTAMGRAGRERVERHFPIERSVHAFEQVYSRCGNETRREIGRHGDG
jgi:glycosyltransferase involved in cell wall biosynthesis